MLLALALIALLSLKPWHTTSLDPSLSISPELGIGLGDAVAVIPDRDFDLAAARAASPGRPVLVDSRARPAAAQDPAPEVGISAARPVQVPTPVPAPPQPVRPQPQLRPPAEPPADPVPVALPAPEPAPVATPVVSPQLAGDADRPHLHSVLDREDGASYVLRVQAQEGEEHAFALGFQVLETIDGEPGADSMLMAIGGDRLLVPVAAGAGHEAVVHFKAASDATGFYVAFFDGLPVGVRGGIGLIEPESGEVRIELSFFRDGELVQDTSEILLDAARLGSTLESVLP